jgi:hypothetical protein
MSTGRRMITGLCWTMTECFLPRCACGNVTSFDSYEQVTLKDARFNLQNHQNGQQIKKEFNEKIEFIYANLREKML